MTATKMARNDRKLFRSGTKTALLAATLLQTAILGWMMWERISLLRDGQAILLDVEPVDPRDLFRGDYVILSYPIGRLKTETLSGDDKFARHDPIYVSLRRGDTGTWRAIAINRALPERPESDIVVLRGTVKFVIDRAETGTNTVCDVECAEISVRYGIESYFVPEGEGRKLEAMRDKRRLQVAARVADNGEAAIAGLAVDGKVRYEDPVIIPFFMDLITGLHATCLSFIAGVMPPMAMLGRSLLYVHNQRVA